MMKAKKLAAVAAAALTLSAVCSSALPQGSVMRFGFSVSAAEAESGTEGELTYQVYADHSVVTACNKDAAGSVRIPASLGGKPVTAVGDKAFSGCKKLTLVEFPDSLTAIGECAFADCGNLSG